jgi:hypothetical protein
LCSKASRAPRRKRSVDSPYMLLVASVAQPHLRQMKPEEQALFGIDKHRLTDRRFIYKSEWDARATYPGKDRGKHRGMIIRTAESVFGALLCLTEKCGRVFP